MGRTDNNVPDTQTQDVTQSSQLWVESQPIETMVWGRLYTRNRLLKSLDLCKEKFSAGRAESNDLVLKGEDLPEPILCRISKVHFSVTRDLDGQSQPVYIQDFSRNGTFVNGEKIGTNNRRILMNDDIISLSNPSYKVYVFKDLNPNDATDLPIEITSKYYIGRKLGFGACGIVRLAFDRKTCNEYAMKQVPKNVLYKTGKTSIANDPERVLNEAKIMKALEHPCVIKMVDIVDKPDSVFMVLEFMRGGDLLTRILNDKKLTEPISKLYFYQMCHAVKYLHDKGITHRDLKPDNVLLETSDEETLIKVSDFGMSKLVRNNSIMRTVCGTPLYIAPEVLLTGGRGSYTKQVDIWSLGVLLYTCLTGKLPFSDDYGTPVTNQIKMAKIKFGGTAWDKLSEEVKLLITEMLTVDPEKRPSIEYILNHKWLDDPTIIRKAKNLMKKIPHSLEDDENFLEPPKKRLKREHT